MDNERIDGMTEKKPDVTKLSILNIVLFFIVAGIGLFSDLATKHRAFESLGMPGEYRRFEEPELHAVCWIWEGVFGIQTSLNEGALFGMGQGRSNVFAGLSLLALTGIVVWVFHSARKSRFLVITLGLITAGILGNLYDRLGWHNLLWNYTNDLHVAGEPVYAVRDWILVMIGSWPWPNFNIADSMLVCGAAMLVLHSFLMSEETEPAPESSERKKISSETP